MDIGPLTLFTAVLGVFAIRAAYKLWMGGKASPDRGWHMWTAALLTAAAMVAGYFEAAFHHRQQLASEALVLASGVPGARANCARIYEEMFNLGTFDGYVFFDGSNVAHLRRDVCLELAAYASGGFRDPTEDQMLAVHVLTHEAWHIAGLTVESETECNAVQTNHEVAEFLGASPEQARALQARYYRDIYPRLWDEYRSSQCAEGGELDMNPDRTEFP